MATITPFRPRTILAVRLTNSETLIGSRYQYTITSSPGPRYWVTCEDIVSHRQVEHGPFTEDQALKMVASRVQREEDSGK